MDLANDPSPILFLEEAGLATSTTPMIRLLIPLGLATLCPLCHAQDSLESKVARQAKPYLDSNVVVGLSIAVIKGDQSATVHFGKVSQDGKAPDDDTVYEIGSISKVFTGILLADAVKQGKAELDQPAQRWLPDDVTMPRSEDREITLLDIATHTSGLPRLPDNIPSLTGDDPYSDYTSTLAYEFLNGHKLQRAPGVKHEYSNFAASLLGHMISRDTGKTYDQLLGERIAEPLGMTDTSVELSPAMAKRMATGHVADGEPTNRWTFADMPGAGGINSTTADMMTFAKACLDPPDDEVGEAIKLSMQKHYNGTPPMGLGWHIAGDQMTRWHNGQTGGFHAMLLVNQPLQLAVVVLTNTATTEVDQLANSLIQVLAGVDVIPRQFDDGKQIDPEVMERYVGKYQLVPGFLFTVSVKDGRLMVGLTGQPTFQVYARTETEWFYKVVDATLTFQMHDGECIALELFQNGVRQVAKRVEE